MKILVLCDRDWTHPQAGGAGINLRRQTERWLDAGHEVKIFTVAYPGALKRERRGRLEVIRRGGSMTVYAWAWLMGIRGMARDCDVVYEVINGIPWLSSLVMQKPVVAMIHHVCQHQFDREVAEPFRSIGKQMEGRLMPALYRKTPFVVVSDSVKADLEALGVPSRNVRVVHNGVDRELLTGPDERATRPTLVYVGRLKAYKRVDLLITIVKHIAEEVPDVALEIVGDGDFRERLQDLARAAGLGNRVVFHGHVSEDEKLGALSRAWVSVTASDIEGWGLSVMEAAACGTPTVAFNLSGLAESVIDGKTGFLAETEADFVAACIKLIRNPSLRDEMGEAARGWAAGFDWNDTADRTLEVLSEAAR